MEVRVRLFAVLRERAQRDEVTLELPEGATVADALDALRSVDGLGPALERLSVVMAVNRGYAEDHLRLSEGDEVALIPPVSGGEDDPPHVRVTREPLCLDALARRVRHPGAGAIVCFQGTTRDVERLEYEAYEEMAEECMRRILEACLRDHGLQAAAAEHRVGSVPLGEASVVVAVSAAHREEAFAGAREAIDAIKAQAPIWKREVQTRGGRSSSEWVDGQPPPRRSPA